MIMTRTMKGYSISATEKDGKELVMEMLRASCQVLQELSYEWDTPSEELIQEIFRELNANMKDDASDDASEVTFDAISVIGAVWKNGEKKSILN